MPAERRRFDARDLDTIAEMVSDEHSRRKRERKDREREWEEIDRQLRMEPDNKFKKLPNGKVDPERAWMAEQELPLQAQALEVLTADARRMMFPPLGTWFGAKAALTDEYLERVDFTGLVAGDENEVPSLINQDNANRLVEGFLSHLHRQYDFFQHIDLINAEAFKYGVGVGRLRMVTKRQLIDTAKGTLAEDVKFPAFLPRSIKNTYLDNDMAVMGEGLVVGPAVIHEKTQHIDDLKLAAEKGSNDPDDENGGWMPSKLKNIEGDQHGNVGVIEWEGDLIVPRKTVESFVVPGVIVTVVHGKDGKNASKTAVVRLRFRQDPFTSYITFPYHPEHIDSAYAVSPLMKGRTVQSSATFALNRLLDSAMLNIIPPIGYDRSDLEFVESGGPRVAPGELWGTLEEIKVHEISDPSAMLQAYVFLLSQYADMTGINAPRLGQQTVSHTTAFAKQQELVRGTVRTVDYVRSAGKGPLTRLLHMEYAMGRRGLGRRTDTVFIDEYNGFVDLTRSALPDTVTFEWLGAAGPDELAARSQTRMASAQIAIQLDQLNVQMGGARSVDIGSLIKQVLREGGWTDIDTLLDVSGAGNVAPGAAVAALQRLGATGEAA